MYAKTCFRKAEIFKLLEAQFYLSLSVKGFSYFVSDIGRINILIK